MKTRFARQQPCAEIWTIDKTLAQELYDTSPGNRKIRPWYYKLLAAAMSRGEWRITSQGIGIDIDGFLRDAHHRMLAVIEADAKIQSVVVLGLRKDAYEVIDTGMKRTLSDLMELDKRVSEIIRLGTSIANTKAGSKPTTDQCWPYYMAGLGDCAESLIEFCGTQKKYFASAAMRLAACVTIMNGGDSGYVLDQYRAMVLLDFDVMSQASKALYRQVDQGKAQATSVRETLARGLRVFDVDKQGITKIQVSDADIENAGDFVRAVLNRSLTDFQKAA